MAAADERDRAGGKLVRDRIPDLLRAEGLRPEVVVLDDSAYRRALRRKLFEEAREAADAGDETLLDELADLYELIVTIAEVGGASVQAVVAQAERKRAARGGFHRRLWLAAVRPSRADEAET